MVRPEGRAVRAELLVRAGRDRAARAERCRQDDADAGHHRPARAEHRHRSACWARPPGRPSGPAVAGARARGRGRPAGAHRPPARALRGRPPRRGRPTAPSTASLDTVGLPDVADRRVGGFSKGMRQRTKVAAALVTDPTVLVLDEPLNGADPVQRAHLIALFRQLGAEGRTVIVSSHVLHEVERLADRQIVLVRGRLAAAGDHRAIRDAMADRPRRVLVRTPATRPLAARAARARRRQQRGRRRAASSSCRPPARGDVAVALPAWPGRSTPASRRSDPSTTPSRACSGSWSDDRRHGRRGLHAAGLPAGAALVDAGPAVRGRGVASGSCPD